MHAFALTVRGVLRSSEFALRSYLYLVLHALVAGPAALWLGAGPGARQMSLVRLHARPLCLQYDLLTRHLARRQGGRILPAAGRTGAVLGVLRDHACQARSFTQSLRFLCIFYARFLPHAPRHATARLTSFCPPDASWLAWCLRADESKLWRRAVRDYAGARTAQLLLLLLAASAGMWAAATALLPSSFVMYFVTLAAAGVLDNRPLLVVVASVIGILLGWPVAGAVRLPCLSAVAAMQRARVQWARLGAREEEAWRGDPGQTGRMPVQAWHS